MAATKFKAIYVNNEGKIIEREIPGMNTYKIATKFANILNNPEETKLVCVVESWKLYPKENEKTEKKTKWMILNKEFTTFKAFKTYAWYNLIPGEVTTGVELFEDTIYKEYRIKRTERRLIVEKSYDMWEEYLQQLENLQLKLF